MQNLEIKCRYADHDRAARLARDLGADLHGRLAQTDTYFHIRPGRLKLRHTRSGPIERYELIHYRRWNRPSARTRPVCRVRGRTRLSLSSSVV